MLRSKRLAAAAVTAMAVLLVPAGGAAADAADDRTITVMFIRHAESEGNTSGCIDTTTPGPGVTELGRHQAAAVAETFDITGFDGVYASSMVRTQQTAGPLSERIGEQITVLPGIREVEAGVYEGQPQDIVARGYLEAPLRWLRGDRSARIPGSIDGNEFDARFDEAVQEIYDSGDVKPVAFSHGAAIMFWILMNVEDPEVSLLRTQPLSNTGRVTVTGSPDRGWTLIDWVGAPVAV